MTTEASGVMQVKNEFNEMRGTDPRLSDEPFQLSAQEWSQYMKHHVSPMTVYPVYTLYRMCSVLSIECVLDMTHHVSPKTVCAVSHIAKSQYIVTT